MNLYFTSIANWDEDGPAIRSVRRLVFIEEQGVAESLEEDSDDFLHTHALATDAQGNAIGTGRLLETGRIGRMAVLSPWRRKGVGSALLALLVQTARGRGMKRLELNSQIDARQFYARRGFIETGGIFMEAGIEHVTMVLDLA